MRRVIWSDQASDDLLAQIEYISDDDPDAALRVSDAITMAAAKLGVASTGRPGRVAGTYEKSLPRLSYVIVYAIQGTNTGETLTILRVIHSARDWPGGGWPGD